MKSLYLIPALISIVLADSNEDKIVGGSEVTPHAYPFTAAITLEGLCCCGGSIIGILNFPAIAYGLQPLSSSSARYTFPWGTFFVQFQSRFPREITFPRTIFMH